MEAQMIGKKNKQLSKTLKNYEIISSCITYTCLDFQNGREKKRLKIYKINNAKDVLKRRKQYFPHQRLLLTLKQDKKKIISKHIMVTCWKPKKRILKVGREREEMWGKKEDMISNAWLLVRKENILKMLNWK